MSQAPTMRLWAVEIRWNLVVRAEDEKSAIEAGREAFEDVLFDDPPSGTRAEPIRSLIQLPMGWDGSCRPYGERDDEDRTIAEQLDGRTT